MTTYAGSSPILGQGTVSAEAIDAWFASHGPSAAKQFAPDKTYRPAPEGLGDMIVRACAAWGADATVNHDLIAADIAHESAFWQSAIVRDKNNPSGLGAVNDNAYNGAVTFSEPYGGILATVAHMLTYAVGKGPWNDSDPRYEAVKAAAWLGAAPTLMGLNGKWAWPGTAYGQSIAAAANALVDFANNGTWIQEPMMQPPSGWKPPQIVRSIIEWDASNRPHQRLNGGSWDFITTHNTGNPNAGANAAMHAAWMHNLGKAGAEEPSWHYTVDEAVIYQHMEDDWAGYHASDNTGPGNFDSLGIELVEIGNLTLVIWNAAWLVAKKMKERGKTDIAAVVKQHNHFARDGKNCPRLLRANHGKMWNEYLNAIAYFLHENAQPEPAPTPDKLILPGQGSESPDVFPPDAGLQRGFKGVYLALGAAKYPDDPALGILTLTGWAKGDEFEGSDGCVYQRFHRVTLQYDPRNAEPWNIVQMHPDTPLPERKAA
jgi:hypothetical protein